MTAYHPLMPAPLVTMPAGPPLIIPKIPLSPDGPGGHEKRGSETQKTPKHAPIVKRSLSKKPRKTSESHRDGYSG